ncbi:hypothetical protein [Streptomyces nitrosporeus]|uniref:pPIWI_RE_Y domain-containing protein n=1 Tax=Streptomyces nitrosporeus TaxID=28894 RepID=UPI0039A2D456
MRARSAGRREAAAGGTDAEGGLFHELATAVAALSEPRNLRSFALPYPGFAQRALDRTVMRCIDLGEDPPKSLPELWEWCRGRTADDPLFDVPPSLVTPDTTLVHAIGLMPTRACLEVASQGSADGVAAEARTLLAELEARCVSAGQYQRCRRFLAHHPVIQQEDRYTPGWDKSVWTLAKGLYRPMDESLLTDGLAMRCRSCGLPGLLDRRRDPAPVPGRPVTDGEAWCEGEECPRGDAFDLIRDPRLSLILPLSLRVFLVLPHRVEEEALNALDHAGADYEAVPGHLCAYRLRATGAGTLDVRMYDRVQPGLLAAHLARDAPLADHTFVVVPQRLAGRASYRTRFTAGLPAPLRERLVLTTPDSLVPHIWARTR